MKRFLSLFLGLCLLFQVEAQDFGHPLDYAEWITTRRNDAMISPVFVRTFTPRKNVRRATLYVCALGHFNAYLDGSKVGEHFLDPGWSCYAREARYVKFDVTRALRESADNVLAGLAQRWKRGEHELRVEVGGGYYELPCDKAEGQDRRPKLRLRLQIEYETGRDENILTDDFWRVGEGQLTYSQVTGGEEIDLRRELQLLPIENIGREGPDLPEQDGTEVVVIDSFLPKAHWQLPNGDWIYDFGQEMSAIPSAMIQGESGQEVSFMAVEPVSAEAKSFRPAASGWHYNVILADKEMVSAEPKFSYSCFRYLQIHGAIPAGEANSDGFPVVDELKIKHTSSILTKDPAGSFECNLQELNELHEQTDWTLRSNLQSFLTNVRYLHTLSEKNEDYAMLYSMYYRYDLTPLSRKMMCDLEAWYSNRGWNLDDKSDLCSTFIVLPWYHYQWTGGDELFRRHFAAMQRYMDCLTHRATVADSASSIYLYGLELMSKMARILSENHPEDMGMSAPQLLSAAQEYEALIDGYKTEETITEADDTDENLLEANSDEDAQSATDEDIVADIQTSTVPQSEPSSPDLQWLYSSLGGLHQEPGTIGWSSVVIEPHPVAGVTDCKVSCKTPKGKISVHWWIENNMCKINYTAPKSIKIRVVNPAETGELKND